MNIKKTIWSLIQNDTACDLPVCLTMFCTHCQHWIFVSVKTQWLAPPARPMFRGYFHSLLWILKSGGGDSSVVRALDL